MSFTDGKIISDPQCGIYRGACIENEQRIIRSTFSSLRHNAISMPFRLSRFTTLRGFVYTHTFVLPMGALLFMLSSSSVDGEMDIRLREMNTKNGKKVIAE